MRAFAPVLAAITVAACGSRPRAEGPEETLRAYVAAAERGDADTAWALLSKEQRDAVSRDEMRRAFAENPEEVREQARALQRLLGEPIPATSEVRAADGRLVVLALEDGQWRVAGGVGQAESLRTPRHTLHALRRALERRSYDAVMRLLAQSSRAQIEDEVRRLLQALEDVDALELTVDGERARIEYETGHVVELVLEDGEWRVEDMD